VFSSVNGLPFTPSANGVPLLFGRFTGNTPLSDPSETCTWALRLVAFAHRPAAGLPAGVSEVSRFSCMKASAVLGSTTTQG
jgi:hypothetical protein